MKVCQIFQDGGLKCAVFQRNLIFDIVRRRIQKAPLQVFLEFLKSISPSPPGQIADSIHGFLSENQASLLHAGHTIPRKYTRDIARVMNGGDFLRYHVIDRTGRRLPFCAKRNDSKFAYISRYCADNRIDRYLNTSSHLTGALPIVWVTRIEKLQKLRVKEPDNLRNVLGLNHYNEDQLLICVKIPDDSQRRIRNPTAFDAGVNYVYWSRGAAGSWGRTTNLRTLTEGLPEAVSKPIKLVKGVRITTIGRIQATHPVVNFSDLRSKAQPYGTSLCENGCILKFKAKRGIKWTYTRTCEAEFDEL